MLTAFATKSFISTLLFSLLKAIINEMNIYLLKDCIYTLQKSNA